MLLQTLFLLLSPDILEFISIFHFLDSESRGFFCSFTRMFSLPIDGFLCVQLFNADCLGCSFCGAIILLSGAKGVAP